MRERKFYPRQVAKTLNGRDPVTLSSGERAALRLFAMKGRRTDVEIQMVSTAENAFKSASIEEASSMFSNANLRIVMNSQDWSLEGTSFGL